MLTRDRRGSKASKTLKEIKPHRSRRPFNFTITRRPEPKKYRPSGADSDVWGPGGIWTSAFSLEDLKDNMAQVESREISWDRDVVDASGMNREVRTGPTVRPEPYGEVVGWARRLVKGRKMLDPNKLRNAVEIGRQ